MALRGKVVDLGGLYLLNDADEVGRIGHVPVVHVEPHVLLMRIVVQVIHPASIEGRGTALHPMHGVTLGEQKLGEERAVLASNASN